MKALGIGLMVVAVAFMLGAFWWWALAGMTEEAGGACMATVLVVFLGGLITSVEGS